MHVTVLADTHLPRRGRDLPPVAWRHIDAGEAVLHAGDITTAEALARIAARRPVWAVRGNNDREPELQRLPERLQLDLGGVLVGMVHDSGGQRDRRHRLRRWFPRARVVVFGHSHIPVIEDDGDLLLLNPGSPTDRRRMPSFTLASLDLEDGVVRARLVDLGRERAV